MSIRKLCFLVLLNHVISIILNTLPQFILLSQEFYVKMENNQPSKLFCNHIHLGNFIQRYLIHFWRSFRDLNQFFYIYNLVIYKVKVNLSGQNQYSSKFNYMASIQVRNYSFSYPPCPFTYRVKEFLCQSMLDSSLVTGSIETHCCAGSNMRQREGECG